MGFPRRICIAASIPSMITHVATRDNYKKYPVIYKISVDLMLKRGVVLLLGGVPLLGNIWYVAIQDQSVLTLYQYIESLFTPSEHCQTLLFL